MHFPPHTSSGSANEGLNTPGVLCTVFLYLHPWQKCQKSTCYCLQQELLTSVIDTQQLNESTCNYHFNELFLLITNKAVSHTQMWILPSHVANQSADVHLFPPLLWRSRLQLQNTSNIHSCCSEQILWYAESFSVNREQQRWKSFFISTTSSF